MLHRIKPESYLNEEIQTPETIEPSTEMLMESSLKPYVRLTPRDYEVFSFLLDQGFATLEALYFRFFDVRKSAAEPLPKNLEVTRQRLRLLEKNEFLSTERVHSESKSVYLLTKKGFYALRQKRGEGAAYALPLRAVDFRYYEHDKAITYCRVGLEREKKAYGWYPERRIKLLGYSHGRETLPQGLIPDGIFTDSKGERVALEFESTRKARGRYELKVRDYRYAIRAGLFQKVLYVVYRGDIARELINATAGRNDFLLEHYDHFRTRLAPKGVVL